MKKCLVYVKKNLTNISSLVYSIYKFVEQT